MFTDDDNLSLLWEVLCESNITDSTGILITLNKDLFDLNIKNFSQSNNDSDINIKNKKFIDNFISLLKTQSESTVFEKHFETRQNTFFQSSEPPKIELSDNIQDKPIDISQQLEKLEQLKQSRNLDVVFPDPSTIPDYSQNIPNSISITDTFVNKLKITTPTVSESIDISKKVSFLDSPNDFTIQQNDILAELKDIKRRINILISSIENNTVDL
tara:strand:+ start:20607 stop:21248 length:642 start_codon:yes stop_codon:yes gene_type:complete